MDLDEEEYKKGVKSLKFSVVSKIFLRKGYSLPITMELKTKLGDSYGLSNFKLVPMGAGHYHVTLGSMDEQCKFMAYDPINISLRTFRVARWQPGFDLSCLKITI